MHLTPEQIDRQPFRMTRRGYDIVQVRDFLREIASEMRERQRVRDRLAEDGDGVAAAEEQAKAIISNAHQTAAGIVADAHTSAGSVEVPERHEERAAEIVAAAEAEAQELLEDAEDRARERSGVVIAEAQARLDRLLAEERDLREQIDSKRASVRGGFSFGAGGTRALATAAADPTVDFRDRTDVAGPDTSLADFMKATLRHEVHPD